MEEFSMANVVRNIKNTALEHAHLPAEVATKLFEKEAMILYLTADHASWVYHVPRYQMLCGDMGSYRFSGMTYEAQPTFPQALEHAVQHMQRIVVNPATNHSRLSGGLVNWYANGDHYIGPHADDERDMIACSPIVALSLGATRRFVFTKKTSKSVHVDETAVARLELQVEDGDLLIMGGTTQRTHKHAVPKMARCCDPRISITLRCFH
ncbi:hypothetical protein BBO99_00002180 [Phytophthora kernoviae]|uniref:Fe2OG dioxygenase domain-containing protein n=2 Tax=Phytophthora kernoviae TaxID=325452 RepID=A0A3R7K265_9STRA|nr:hypothetical protein G195_002498 [Phytophthora kernoviae 00238/432]KAG2529823.1 hypothetical protein JM16_001813 [Phytophthora kernoviae]KAG2531196.1 hypothetical protein JM18_001800 [Phytophthora kernoviae]RLN10594.1 hypothetical protein BBI17_001900 [Phytophthora kernoviae]RLN83347.1 hypothetical protein BBO99_00002180 [Phytophthora kernoviae]